MGRDLQETVGEGEDGVVCDPRSQGRHVRIVAEVISNMMFEAAR
jgi:hypothetical protein